MDIIKEIRKKREELGLYQWEVARKLGMSQQGYHCFERSKGNPQLNTIKKVCEILDLKLSVTNK